jgi:patatin-like phospholipase/acyl hydrolase
MGITGSNKKESTGQEQARMTAAEVSQRYTHPYRILSLDGGGAKGFYSIGVLKEIEAMVAQPLCECFDLVFGTSTGAIIAGLLALGYRVDDIHALYKEHVPTIMRKRRRSSKSAALQHLAESVFGNRSFADVKTGIELSPRAGRWKRP